MVLHVHSFCGYPSVKVFKRENHELDQNHWFAYNFVMNAKGEPIKGFNEVILDGKKFRVDRTTRNAVIDHFGKWGARQLASLGLAAVPLVPIPSSRCIAFDAPCTAKLLADSIAKHSPGNSVSHCLAFRELREPDHTRGENEKGEKSRRQNRAEILANLMIRGGLNSGDCVVLVDDVCTQGHHVLAAADILRHKGATVEHALCIGRTVSEPMENIFAVPAEDVEPSFNWNF